jgi:hypothetical protein
MTTPAAVSLLDRQAASGQQMDLIPSSEMPASLFEHPGRDPVFTAERYAKSKPAEYRFAVALLFGDGLPVKTVAEMLGASRNTVAAIYERESASQSVEQQKRTAAAEWRMITRLGRERIREFLLHLPDAGDLSPEQMGGLIHKIGVVTGIAADKLAVLEGTVVPQVRINVNVDAAGYSDILARARELADRMGLEGGAAWQKGGAAGADGEQVGAGLAAGSGPVVDGVATDLEDDADGGDTDA